MMLFVLKHIFYLYYKFIDDSLFEFDNSMRKMIAFGSILNIVMGYAFFKGVGSNLTLFEAIAIINSPAIFRWIMNRIILGYNVEVKEIIVSVVGIGGVIIVWAPWTENPKHIAWICLLSSLCSCT